MNRESKPEISVESLLRLKRAEQPPPGFWDEFDRELRAKQLTAILEKRPWWRSLARPHRILSRHPVFLGTAAAMAVAAFGLSEYRGRSPAALATGADDAAYVPAESVAALAPARYEIPAAAMAPVADRPTARVVRTTSQKNLPEPFVQELASMLAAPGASPPLALNTTRDEMLQLERSNRTLSTINLAAIQAAEPELMRNTLGFSQNFSATPAAYREQMAEPLAQMTSPSEERRSRLMSEDLPETTAADSAPAAVSDAVVSRLSDERVYESISRYDLDANRVSIKF